MMKTEPVFINDHDPITIINHQTNWRSEVKIKKEMVWARKKQPEVGKCDNFASFSYVRCDPLSAKRDKEMFSLKILEEKAEKQFKTLH